MFTPEQAATMAAIRAALEGRKGQFVRYAWQTTSPSSLKVAAAHKARGLYRVTTATSRFMVAYDAMMDTQERRESGEAPAENAGLRGKEWIPSPTGEHEGLFLANSRGEVFVRGYKSHEHKSTSQWYEGTGEAVSYETVKQYLQPAALKPRERREGGQDTFDVNIKNVLVLGSYSA